MNASCRSSRYASKIVAKTPIRVVHLVFPIMCLMCAFTVGSVFSRAEAISLFVQPLASKILNHALLSISQLEPFFCLLSYFFMPAMIIKTRECSLQAEVTEKYGCLAPPVMRLTSTL